MTFQAKDVMARASLTLQDGGAVRWTAMELHGYLNDALREIVAKKPNANSKTVALSMVSGTLQTLPATYTMLSRVIRNLASGAANALGTTAIRPISNRAMLDAQIPGWQSATVMPFAKEVVHVMQDQTDLRTFYVIPGNDGTGFIEAVVGVVPLAVAAPTAGQQLLVANYTATVDFPDLYQNAILDFMLYRAFAKDSGLPNAAARAMEHYKMFVQALTDMNASETLMGLATQNTEQG